MVAVDNPPVVAPHLTEEEERELAQLVSRRLDDHAPGVIWLHGANTEQEVTQFCSHVLGHFQHGHFTNNPFTEVNIANNKQGVVLHTHAGHHVTINHDSQDYHPEAANDIQIVAHAMTSIPMNVDTIILKAGNTELQNKNFLAVAKAMGLNVRGPNGELIQEATVERNSRPTNNAGFDEAAAQGPQLVPNRDERNAAAPTAQPGTTTPAQEQVGGDPNDPTQTPAQPSPEVAELRQQLTDQNQHIEGQKTALEELQKQLAEIKTQLGSKDKDIVELTTIVEGLQKDVRDQDNQLQAQAKQLVDQDKAHTETIKGLVQEAEENAAKVEAAHKAKVGELDKSIAALQTQVTELQEGQKTAVEAAALKDAEALKLAEAHTAQVGELQGTVAELKQQLATSQTAITDHKKVVTELSDTISQLQEVLKGRGTRGLIDDPNAAPAVETTLVLSEKNRGNRQQRKDPEQSRGTFVQGPDGVFRVDGQTAAPDAKNHRFPTSPQLEDGGRSMKAGRRIKPLVDPKNNVAVAEKLLDNKRGGESSRLNPTGIIPPERQLSAGSPQVDPTVYSSRSSPIPPGTGAVNKYGPVPIRKLTKG